MADGTMTGETKAEPVIQLIRYGCKHTMVDIMLVTGSAGGWGRGLVVSAPEIELTGRRYVRKVGTCLPFFLTRRRMTNGFTHRSLIAVSSADEATPARTT